MKLLNVRVHITISGRVQGVFFRSEILRKANKLGITGWVQNLLDGQVEALFEGEEKLVKELIEYCKQGPKSALVTHLDVKWEAYKGEFGSFKVKYGY